MRPFQLIKLLILCISFYSCNEMTNYQVIPESEITMVDSLIYYNGKPFTGEIVKKDKKNNFIMKGFIKKGKDHNAYYELDNEGFINRLAIYEDGQEMLKQNWYESGEIKLSIRLNPKNKNGKYLKYFPNGNIMTKSNLLDGVANGKVYYYRRNGSTKAIFNYERGVKEGLCTLFNKEDNIVAEGYMKEDKQDGEWFFVHENKMDTTFITYELGEQKSVKGGDIDTLDGGLFIKSYKSLGL